MSLSIKKVDRFQTCNFCSNEAHYDAPMRGYSSWAYFCEDCYVERGGSRTVGTKFELMTQSEVDYASEGSEAYDPDLEAAYLQEVDIEEMMRESLFGDSCGVECADGCMVEPDGKCPHGYSSPLVLTGLF